LFQTRSDQNFRDERCRVEQNKLPVGARYGLGCHDQVADPDRRDEVHPTISTTTFFRDPATVASGNSIFPAPAMSSLPINVTLLLASSNSEMMISIAAHPFVFNGNDSSIPYTVKI
jgi:hypothetical protein